MRNFRDLSYLGLKEGMLLRSDVLYKLTFKERRMLKKDHNLKVVVDLRHPLEIKKLKDSKMFRVKYYNLPMVVKTNDPSVEVKRTLTVNNLTLSDMTYFYQCFVDPDRKEIWTKIFELLLEDNDKGILFHCSAGKDRTGIVIAVILTVLGFDKETIYRDYLLTNENPLYFKTIAEKMDEESKAIFLEHYKAKKEYLDESFKKIDENFGSMDNFLKECCSLNDEKIVKIKEKYLK